MALAPRRALLGVPSRSISALSSPDWSSTSKPATALAISPLTLATACVTPLPPHSVPPSRSSVASNSPVEAPDGTAARPCAPESSASSTSTVGLPRESRIWRAWTDSMLLTSLLRIQTGPRVVGELGIGIEIVPSLALRCGEVRGRLYPGPEALRRGPQRELRIHLQLARHVDGGEQHVAHLAEGLLPPLGGLELVQLGAHRVE